MSVFTSTKPFVSKEEAQAIGEYVHSTFGGKITAQQLLDAARPKESFLHRYFDWDDSSAAEKYRLSQARSLIISIQVQADDNKPMRSFLNVTVGTSKSYTDCNEIRNSSELVEQVIGRALDELVRWKGRYSRYCEFFGVVQEIDKTIHELKGNKNGSESKEGSSDRGKKRIYSRGNSEEINVNN